MCAAFNQAGCGNQSQLSLLLQLADVQSTAVAHGGTNLCQSQVYVVLQAACIRNVGVNAFFEGQLSCAAHIIALPVAGTAGAFTPVFLHVGAVDVNLVGRAFVETSEVTAQHHEVCAHSQSQSHVVVVNDTAVGAYRNVYAGFFEVFVTSLANLDQSSCLTTANALLLTSDADGAAADTNFNKVSTCISQEAEAFSVNNVASANLYAVAIMLTDPVQSDFLPCARRSRCTVRQRQHQ